MPINMFHGFEHGKLINMYISNITPIFNKCIQSLALAQPNKNMIGDSGHLAHACMSAHVHGCKQLAPQLRVEYLSFL